MLGAKVPNLLKYINTCVLSTCITFICVFLNFLKVNLFLISIHQLFCTIWKNPVACKISILHALIRYKAIMSQD